MKDIKELMKDHYLRYASYVILDRAIPNVVDGLKPVQRRILHTLFKMHDGKLHKVANVAGQTMAYHPHGDAPINEALVHLANRGFLLDTQGNFGNPVTGDGAAAPRYIETRLSQLAKDTLFNPALTEFIPSYDGRNQEPVLLPVKIPLLLMLGGEGIAVGMATKIFPHNFKELIEAEIAVLEERSYKLFPDFQSGGIADCSLYDKGHGKVKLRARIEVKDQKTLVIREICFGTTTESLIHSITEASKKGKIKIDSITDYTSEKVNIEIVLPRGQYAEELIDHLYAYTDCEVTLHSQPVVIKEGKPVEMSVNEMLEYHVECLKGYLKKELEIAMKVCDQVIFEKTLEQIFIEKKIYKTIEEVEEYSAVYGVLEKGFQPYLKLLERLPEKEDYDRLLSIPIRRIGRFDRVRNENDIKAKEKERKEIAQHLKTLTKYTISYLKNIREKYAEHFPRKTKIKKIEEIDKRSIETKDIVLNFDAKSGYLGTNVEGKMKISCTNFDKILIVYKSGTYKVISIPEKQYIGQDQDKVVHVGVADKKSVFSCCYQDKQTKQTYAKRFIVKQYILDKVYRFFEEGGKLQYIGHKHEVKLRMDLEPKPKQKTSRHDCDFKSITIKNVQSKGIRIHTRPVLTIEEI